MVSAKLSSAYVGDHNKNGVNDLMVKFSRSDVYDTISVGLYTIDIKGFVNGQQFSGDDTVTVIDGGH